MIPARALAGLSLLLPMAAAAAERDRYEAEWLVLRGTGGTRTVTLQEKRSEPFAEMIPRTAFRLAAPAADAEGRVIVPAGTIMTGVRGRPGIRCEVIRRSGQARSFCLHDSDRDGRFDGWNTLYAFNANGGGEVFFAAPTWRPETKALATPVAMTTLDPRREAPRFVVEIWFSNRAEWVGKNVLMPCIVPRQINGLFGKVPVRLCQQAVTLGNNDYPYGLALYGGSATFVSREENRVQLRIIPPPADYAF